MSYSKVGELVELLDAKTKKGELGWEDTEYENMFLTSFPDYSVRISFRDSVEPDVPPESLDYFIQIINSDGDIVDQVSDIDLRDIIEDPYPKLKDIHDGARRKALGIDTALDSILESLKK